MQLPSTQSVARRMTPRLAQLAAANSLDEYANFIPGLDALAAGTIEPKRAGLDTAGGSDRGEGQSDSDR